MPPAYPAVHAGFAYACTVSDPNTCLRQSTVAGASTRAWSLDARIQSEFNRAWIGKVK